MEIIPDKRRAQLDPEVSILVEFFESNEGTFGLRDAILYYDFPLYKDDDNIVISKALLVSPTHGVTVIGTSKANSLELFNSELDVTSNNIEKVFSHLYSRLIRNRALKKTITELKFSTNAVIFAPNLPDIPGDISLEAEIINTLKGLEEYLAGIRSEKMPSELFIELNSTIDGAKGLIRQRPRELLATDKRSKGQIVNLLESEITSFDQRQKYGYVTVLDGFQRIRGLAGSGKTVVLAMKAALTHLRYPDATIVYTFYTRSLYQHIRRLITRFYRQFDDRDPDWTRLLVLHGWGGHNADGFYFSACNTFGVQPITYTEAYRRSPNNPFEFVCKNLLETNTIEPLYDYIFVDEGQDFPISFLKLCMKLAKNARVVYAYDELQTIFQKSTPTPKEIGEKLTEDVVLYKCYRNPREVITIAHAIGFGIYSSRIVQMLENKEHWEDIGYKVREGDFTEGSNIIIERPAENSLAIISNAYIPKEIIQAHVFDNFSEEIKTVAKCIRKDVSDGLRPDDILVAVVDDSNAKNYLNELTDELNRLEIRTHNIHSDTLGIVDFQKDGHVTLSTVHKAKGNEAYGVYIVGVDALYTPYAGVRARNILFTAITRAKGWVYISGIGEAAKACQQEINTAIENFPFLRFPYPSREQIKIMQRDLAEKDARKQKAERMLDQIMETMTPDEIARFIERREIKKGK